LRGFVGWALGGLAGLLGLASTQCGGAAGDDPLGTTGQAIVAGSQVAPTASPVLYLTGPQGACTAVLIAPTLVATAHHCVAQLIAGNPQCTSAGDLVPTGDGAGEIGNDDAPASLSFFSAARLAAGQSTSDADALGAQIFSAPSPSICRDDIAFVVLDRVIPGLLPAAVRIDEATQAGEAVTVFGYGLTDQLDDPTLLRERDDGQVVGVGPDSPTTVPQAAPVRSLRIGPGTVTCNGDSGGPVVSTASGAVVGLVSLGTQATSLQPYCVDGSSADTTGPRLAAYCDLAMSAFAAAGATPIREPTASDAAGLCMPMISAPEAGPPQEADGAQPSPPVGYGVTRGSCAMAFTRADGDCALGGVVGVLAVMAMAAGRRRRR
jgi:hypothetical protein